MPTAPTADPEIPRLVEAIRAAHAEGTPLCLVGGDSKGFLGRPVAGRVLALAGLRGIRAYEPAELFITVAAGTPLTEVQEVLAAHGQYLPWEPPIHAPSATVGGMVAAGLSGPGRPWRGAVRDFVLGVTLVDGKGEVLRFGGQVMKNVAGFDCSRLMAGAFGTLGVLLECSLKVLPRAAREVTLVRALSAARALPEMVSVAQRCRALTAASHDGEHLYLRLSGPAQAVEVQAAELAASLPGGRAALGERLPEDSPYWRDLAAQRLPFFAGDAPLWRLSLPPATPALPLPGPIYSSWAGAERWWRGDTPAAEIQALVAQHGGHACLFRGGDRQGEVFAPLSPAARALHQRLKAVFDPVRILNPGRMYADL